MIGRGKNMKDMIITHAKDVDGVSPVILLQLIKRKVDFYLLEIEEVEEKVPALLKEDLKDYEHIYVTDLSLGEELYEWIDQQPWKEKFHLFDHHISQQYASQYSFVTLDVNECATSLFYKYLKTNHPLLQSPKIEQYVTHVFHLDLWHWVKKNDFTAKKLGDLFGIYGNLGYIEHFVKNLEEESIPIIADAEAELLEIEESRIQRYFERKKEQLMEFRYQHYKMGVVFAENYRSELGMLLQGARPDLDFIAMINASGGVSLRTQREDVDLAEIASSFGGGGHKKASGFGISDDVKVAMIKNIFIDVEKMEENI